MANLGDISDGKFCYDCGEKVEMKATVCIYCGVAQPRTPRSRIVDKHRRYSRRFLIGGIFLGLSSFGNLSMGSPGASTLGVFTFLLCIVCFIQSYRYDRMSNDIREP